MSQSPDTKDYAMILQGDYCEKCGKEYSNIIDKWCKSCQINDLKMNFISWTSKNEKIDNFIQEIQLKINEPNSIIFEWIPYNQFNEIKKIGKGGFVTVYSATWKNEVALICFNNSEKILIKV